MTGPLRALEGLTAVATLAALLACAGAPPAPPVVHEPAPPVEVTPAPDPDLHAAAPDSLRRWAVRPVPVPNAFAAAVAAGTRTSTGEPGPRYWRQRVDYRIEAELDPASALVRGAQTITYHNDSPYELESLVLRLYQNLFAEGAMRNRTVPVTGGLTLERVSVRGTPARRVADADARHGADGTPRYTVDGTIMRLALPRPIPPGGALELDVAWRFRVPPRGAPRMGRIGEDVFTVAQWYPQVAVYDDLNGWHEWPYLGDGEFYLEYGDFEVALTLPEGWIVGATGVLENAHEVLPEPVRARLAAALRGDDVVHVITGGDRGPGAATERSPDGQLTWRFRAADVRDFAFAASPRYLWDATRAMVPDRDGDGVPDAVAVHALYRPEATDWRDAAVYARHALRFHSRAWLPYAYPQLTTAEGPVGGMEYPMIVFVRGGRAPESTYRTTDHEVAHQWNAMMVGPDEGSFAWLDEGINSYMENLSAAAFLGVSEAEAFEGDLARYLELAGTDRELPIMRHTDLYGPGPQRVTATYSKPAVVLRALETVIGAEAVRAGIRTYLERWLGAHPHPHDFFNTMEAVAGRDLDWFWHPWFYETAVLEQALVAVEVEGRAIETSDHRVRVTVEDRGTAPMPVPLRITLAGGMVRDTILPVDPWLHVGGTRADILVLPGAPVRVEIDPERRLPDIDRANNVWTAAGRP
ncbi:MAG TPA: M1 family metallopeptidase [Longimicrobiales bacterium]|nr:M1 family metallopeptidase [Longimicrobiales bacterium]